MAKMMQKLLTWVLALSMCFSWFAVPAAATDVEEEPAKVDVSVDVAAVSQASAASESLSVVTAEPVTTTVQDAATGVVEQSTYTTTDWSGTNADGAAVTGTETITQVTVTDGGEVTHQGGSVSGSETVIQDTESAESSTQQDVVISDNTGTTQDAEDGEATTETSTETTEQTQEGDWVEGQLVEGEAIVDQSLSGKTEEKTELDLDVTEPTDVTINLTPNDRHGTTVTKYITAEEVICGNISLPEDGTYSEIKDDAGNVIGYEVTTTSESTETRTTQQDVGETVTTNTVAAEVTLPEGVSAGKQTVYAQDGKTAIGETVTEVVPEYDADGKVIKYTITKTTTVNVEETETTQSEADSTSAEDTTTTIRLPEKPEASVSTDAETGVTTTVTVEEIKDDDGNVTGYAITTEKTGADGAAISTETEKKYGTVVTTNITTITDPTTIETITKAQEVTTEVTEITAEATIQETEKVTERLNEYVTTSMEQRDYAYVMIEGKLYYVYTGSMTVSEGEGHGDTSLMNPITPQTSLFNKNGAQDLDQGGGRATDNQSTPTEGFRYIGYGIDTALDISKGDGSSDVVQFRLKDAKGKEYYAMCIDFNTTIQPGHLYDIADLTSEDYYQKDGAVSVESAEKLRIIALNGYWGTADDTNATTDVGSLDEVKTLLKNYLKAENGKLAEADRMSEEDIQKIVDSLTHGQAQAATQAALWKYGNIDGNKKVNENNLVPNGWVEKEGGFGKKKEKVKGEDYINTEYVYKALLALANDPDTKTETGEGVEFLDAEDITAGAITVRSKVVSADESHANNDSNPSNDIYNIDLSFTLGIEPSKLNGDMIVTVTVGDQEVKKVRLAGADDPLLPLGRIVKNEDGSYTIPNVELAEGVSVNLNLSGTQDLGKGVYIYTSLKDSRTDSQTLITLATGSRKVNLDMNMNFSVEEPTATATKVEGTEKKVTKTVDTRTDTRTDRKTRTTINTKTTKDVDFESKGTVQTKVYADVTVNKVTNEETQRERSWFASWEKKVEPKSVPTPQPEDTPTEEEGEKEVTISGKQVPMAQAPKTGDLSALWLAVSGLSLGGMALLNRKRKEEEAAE